MDILGRTGISWEAGRHRVTVPYGEETEIFLSRADHEEFCLKMGRPLSKAKYY